MQQLDAFAPYTDTPRARRSDPETSHKAAERIKPKLRAQQQAVLDAVVSPWGVSALVLIAVYVLSLVLLATIRPPFVMQPPSSRLETETFSAKRAAIGAAVATLVACVVIAIVFIVAFYRKPSVGGKRG